VFVSLDLQVLLIKLWWSGAAIFSHEFFALLPWLPTIVLLLD